MKIEVVMEGMVFVVEVVECENTYNSHAISEPFSRAVCDMSESSDMWALMNKCEEAVGDYYTSIGKKVLWCFPVLEKKKYSFFFKISV